MDDSPLQKMNHGLLLLLNTIQLTGIVMSTQEHLVFHFLLLQMVLLVHQDTARRMSERQLFVVQLNHQI
jgi:hypothetical protein